MSNFTQCELSSIREMVTGHQMVSAKLDNYAAECQDTQIKQMFKTASQQAQQSSQNLIQML